MSDATGHITIMGEMRSNIAHHGEAHRLLSINPAMQVYISPSCILTFLVSPVLDDWTF